MDWLEGVKDGVTRALIARRIDRLRSGLLGDAKSVGDGVSALRIDVGPGWRVYFTQRDQQLILLLAGGSKRTQARDIERAKALAKALKDDTFKDRKARHGQDDPG